jgi:hypothetical protein
MRRVYTVRCGGIDVCFCTLQPFFPRRFRRPPLCFFSEYTVYSTYAGVWTSRLVPSDDGSSATEASRHRLGHRSPGITDMPRANMPVPLPALPSKATVTPCTTARTRCWWKSGPKGGRRHNSPLSSLLPFARYHEAATSTCARRGNNKT